MALPKLPWSKTDTDDGEAIEFSDANGEDLFYINCWDGEDGRGRYNEFDEATAELIIRACNHHDALVDLLEKHVRIKRCENPRREKLGKVDLHGSGHKIETDILHPCGKCDVCKADTLLHEIKGE